MSATDFAVTCYCVGVIADLIGVTALVKAGFDARKAIATIDAKPGLVEHDGKFELNDRDNEVRTALGNQRIIWWSLAALIVGIIVGHAGNMISTLGTH